MAAIPLAVGRPLPEIWFVHLAQTQRLPGKLENRRCEAGPKVQGPADLLLLYRRPWLFETKRSSPIVMLLSPQSAP